MSLSTAMKARLACVLLILAPASGVQAQDGAPSTSVATVTVTARRTTKVAPVTVTATDWCPRFDPARHPADRAPRVVDSYPASGSVVAPGALLVRVSFDAPMSCYSEVTVEGGDDAADPCQPTGTWALPDRRTWLMPCRLQPGATYRIRFRKVDGAGFVGLSGRPAEPFDLAFSTSTQAPTASLEAAQRADTGAPGAGRVTAYVTCADQGLTSAKGCRSQRLRPPA